jgi:anti-sigma B factor antagonist
MMVGQGPIDISTRHAGNVTIVDVNGDITLRSTPEVRKLLLEVLHDKNTVRVFVNLSRVRYIDSAGIASLVEALRVSRDTNRIFAIFGLTKATLQVLELTRLTKVFEIYDTEEDALKGGNVSPR